MKHGDTVKVKNAKGQIFNAIFDYGPYKKDMAKHFGTKTPFIMEFVKVRRFIKTKNEFAATATEYTSQQVSEV
jgi:hypothetical protein